MVKIRDKEEEDEIRGSGGTWMTNTENQEPDEKGNRHRQRRGFEGGTGG